MTFSISQIKRAATRIKKSRGVAYHEALDLASQQAGFANFAHAQQSQASNSNHFDPDVEALRRILADHPDLSDYGLGKAVSFRWTKAQVEEHFAKSRESIAVNIERFRATRDWLRGIAKIKTINPKRSSYGMKHIAEAEIGYITNGVFIAAALSLGFTMRRYPGSPNPSFNISERSITDAWRRIEEQRRRAAQDWNLRRFQAQPSI
ncbi:MAG TPA: hypothetical protein VLC97_09495 [Rhodanobacteraceae bacterium]|nr:hypothetical protein [Rhodanobacteraceae bacterium]